MADRIGVQRKWIQKAGTPYEHFDVSQSKKRLALAAGAQEVGRQEIYLLMRSKKVGIVNSAEKVTDMTDARTSAFAALAQQAIIGNAMIDAGNNSTADHIEATELFAKHYSANGGGCQGLRALAAAWPSDRKSFLAVCEQHGVNKATAATQWAKGRAA